jgi:hypothetical protein
MFWQFANPWMLAGLAGVAIPVLIHLLTRRRATVIAWGAMMFLEPKKRDRRRIRLAELLLMAARMAILALVALALARPLLGRRPDPASGPNANERGPADSASAWAGSRRDVVMVLDGSAAMDRADASGPDDTPRRRAVAWAKAALAGLAPGSTAAVLVARERVEPIVGALEPDPRRAAEALEGVAPGGGGADLAAAVVEALRRLDDAENPVRDVIVLTDGRRAPWRADEPARWGLVRSLAEAQAKRSGVPARVGVALFRPDESKRGTNDNVNVSDGSVELVELSRVLAPPGAAIEARVTIANAGPAPLSAEAELEVDGEPVPGARQVVGPVAPGGKTTVALAATAPRAAGTHGVSVSLAAVAGGGRDPMPANDRASTLLTVASALPVLIVEGEPGRGPLEGASGFLRAALAPSGDDSPAVSVTVVPVDRFVASDLSGARVLVLADVARLAPTLAAAVEAFAAGGGGVLVVLGPNTDASWWSSPSVASWLPAAPEVSPGPRGSFEASEAVVARPAPASFAGPGLDRLGQGDAPPLADASLFAYWPLTPATGAAVRARLSSGDPWVVARPFRLGRVVIVAAPLDARGGTVAVNPDFVPLVHEMTLDLASGAAAVASRPGEPVRFELGRTDASGAIGPDVEALNVTGPDGKPAGTAKVERAGGRAWAHLDTPAGPGLYRAQGPNPNPGTASASPVVASYGVALADPLAWDVRELSEADRLALRDSGGVVLAATPDALLTGGNGPGGATAARPLWRGLILAALAGLALEVALTRRLSRARAVVSA